MKKESSQLEMISIPSTHKDKVEWVRRNLLGLLNNDLSDIDENDFNSGDLEQAEVILAEEYIEEGPGIILSLIKAILPVLVFDLFLPLHPTVYGLVLSTIGTFQLLVYSDINGPESIAGLARTRSRIGVGEPSYFDEEEAKRRAKSTVMTNISLIWIGLGFVGQVIGTMIPGGELIAENYLAFALFC